MIYAFECRVAGTDWPPTMVNAKEAGKAKAEFLSDVQECWPDVKYTDIRCRKVGPAHTSEQFIENAKYRGMPEVRCGQRVSLRGEFGYIVGHNSSANFNVLFDDDSKFNGHMLNVHPSEITLVAPSSVGSSVGNGTCEACGNPCQVFGCKWCKECYPTHSVPA